MNSRQQCARIAMFLCGCAAFPNLYATQGIAVVPALLWSRWGWLGCVVLIVPFQLLSLLIA